MVAGVVDEDVVVEVVVAVVGAAVENGAVATIVAVVRWRSYHQLSEFHHTVF